MGSGALPPDARVSRTADQLSADLDREAVILSLNRGMYFGLNEVGTFIWNQLDDEITVGQLYERVEQRYDVLGERARSDVDELLRRLRDERLVEFRD